MALTPDSGWDLAFPGMARHMVQRSALHAELVSTRLRDKSEQFIHLKRPLPSPALARLGAAIHVH